MSEIEQVIADLEAARRPSRALDWSIGVLFGWVKQVDETTDPQTSELTRKENWVSPATGKFAKVPEYTSILDRAVELALQVGGGSYSLARVREEYRASVGGHVSRDAAPAIALCIAALRHKANPQHL